MHRLSSPPSQIGVLMHRLSPRLEALDLSSNQLGCLSAKAIASSLPGCSSLTRLGLAWNGLAGGTQHIAFALTRIAREGGGRQLRIGGSGGEGSGSGGVKHAGGHGGGTHSGGGDGSGSAGHRHPAPSGGGLLDLDLTGTGLTSEVGRRGRGRSQEVWG